MSQDRIDRDSEIREWERAAIELRTLLESSGIGQRAAAEQLDCPERAMRGFCSGREPVPRAVLLAMRWLAEHKPNQMRWLQVHWKKVGHEVKGTDRFDIRAVNEMMQFVVNGRVAMRGRLEDLEKQGLVTIHTSYSSDRFLWNPGAALTPSQRFDDRDNELPAGELYFMHPEGGSVADLTLAIGNTMVAKLTAERKRREGKPQEVWQAKRVYLEG